MAHFPIAIPSCALIGAVSFASEEKITATERKLSRLVENIYNASAEGDGAAEGGRRRRVERQPRPRIEDLRSHQCGVLGDAAGCGGRRRSRAPVCVGGG